MGIYYNKHSRRQFLVGSGKSLLALPLLPSLLPRTAWGQSNAPDPRMMLFWFDHNQLSSMVPDPARATTSLGGGSREIMMNQLGTMVSHSPHFSNQRYETLKNQNLVTLVRGLDIQHGAAHGNGALAAAQDRNSEGSFPSIDTVIESSSRVYPVGTPTNVRRAIRLSFHRGGGFYRKVGNTVEPVPFYDWYQIQNFYNDVFSSLTGGTAPPQDLTNQFKSNILNRVHASFTSFRNGAKISSDDRARLDQHMDYLSDLQRTFASTQNPPMPTCDRPTQPASNITEDPTRYTPAYLQLMAVAFRCGLTKFGVFGFEGHDPQWIPGINTQGNGIHSIMHGSHGAALQLSVKIRWWQYFNDLIADNFIAPLSEMEGDTGRTYLDNMVTGFLCSGGFANPGGDGGHNGLDSQQVLLGSMGGRMRAGRFLVVPRSAQGHAVYSGNNLPYNCFLITLLQLMGMQPSDYAYATPDGQGFGYYGAFGSGYNTRNRFYQPITELMA